MLRCPVPDQLFLLSIVNSKNIKKEKKCDEITYAVVNVFSPQHSFYVLCLKNGYEEFVRFYCFGSYDPVLRFV